MNITKTPSSKPGNSVTLALERFAVAPDVSYVRRQVVEALFAVSRATLWTKVKQGLIPAPHKPSPRLALWQVGELRRALNAVGGVQ